MMSESARYLSTRKGSSTVCDEVPSASTRKIKIPDACIGLGIKCMTPFEMLRTERARFILGPSS